MTTQRANAPGGWTRSLFRVLGRWTTRRPKTVLAAAFVVTAVAGWLASTLTFQVNFMALLPEHDERVQRFQQITRDFGGTSNLLLLVQGDPAQRAAFLDRLDARILEIPEVKAFDVRVSTAQLHLPPEAWPLSSTATRALARAVRAQPEHALALAEDPGLATVLERGPPLVLATEAAVDSGAVTPAAGIEALARLVEGDPSALWAALGATEGPNLDAQGRVLSPDGSTHLAVIRFRVNVVDLELGGDLYPRVEALTEEAAAGFDDLWWGYTGSIAYSYQDERSVLGRTQWISLASLLGVLLLFLYVQRSLRLTLAVAIPMACALVWTFGAVKLLIGTVTITSAIFGILLFGLSVDFAVHLLVRVQDEREHGAGARLAVRAALQRTGPGILTGGMTTAVAFFALLVSDQPAAWHLGVTTGTGLLCSLAAMLVILPALLVVVPTKGRPRPMRLPGMTRWVSACYRRPRRVLLVTVLLLGVAATTVPQARLEYDLERMTSRDLTARAVQHELRRVFGVTGEFGLCVVDDLERAREVAAELRASPRVARVETAADLLPPDPEEITVALGELRLALGVAGVTTATTSTAPQTMGVRERLRAAAAARRAAQAASFTGDLELARACHRLLEALQAASPTALAELDARLRRQLGASLRAVCAGASRPLGPEDLPEAVRTKYFDPKGNTAVYALARRQEGLGIGRTLHLFSQELGRVCPEGATGLPVIMNILVNEAVQDIPWILLTAALAVIALLWVDLRDPWRIALCFVPLLVAAALAMALLVASGFALSIIVLSGLPLIFGIGVDDGVHLVHRGLEGGGNDPAMAASRVGRAILLTTLTTGLSFGGLLFMNHPAIEGLGFLVSVGVGLCFVTSVTVFPAVARWYDRGSRQ